MHISSHEQRDKNSWTPGPSVKDVHKNTVKIDAPSPCPLLSTLGHTPSPSCGRTQTWLNTQWRVTHGHPVITRCPWVLAAGCQQVLSIYLSIAYTSNASVYMLRARQFIQLVTLSLFLSLSAVHCYTLRTSALANPVWFLFRMQLWTSAKQGQGSMQKKENDGRRQDLPILYRHLLQTVFYVRHRNGAFTALTSNEL